MRRILRRRCADREPRQAFSVRSVAAPGTSTPLLTVVSPTFHPEPIGTPLYATDLSRWFVERGWRVRVVTGQPFYPEFKRHKGYGRRTRYDRLGDIEIFRLPTVVPRGGRVPWRAASELNFAIQGFVRSSQLRAPGSVLSISPGTPWVARVGAALSGDRCQVCLVHDLQSGLAAGRAPSIAARMLRANEVRSLNKAGTVTTLTHDMAVTLRRMGLQRPTEVVPLWSTIDPPESFPPLEAEVQYSGNFGAKQGVEALAVIASGLAAAGIRLRVRGAGPRFDSVLPELRASAGELLAVEDLVPLSELAGALASSPVHLVLQTRGTGGFVMPSKILNALTCGATVIAMADPGSPVHVLAKETPGLHAVPTDSPDEMVRAAIQHLEHALDPTNRRLIAMAASARFSRDAVLPKLARLLHPNDHDSVS